MSLLERLLAKVPDSAGAARVQLAQLGLPGARTEAWRYTSLRALESLDPGASAWLEAGPAALAGVSGDLAQVDGRELTISSQLPAGVRVTPVGAASVLQNADTAAAFRLLNAADVAIGASIDVDGVVPGVWRLSVQHAAAGLVQYRQRIRLQSGAALTLVEHLHGSDAAAGLSNALIEVEVASGARLIWVRLQEFGSRAHAVQRTEVRIAGGGQLQYVVAELGGLWSRHELQLDLEGPTAIAAIHGLAALQGRQHHDTQLSLHHRSGAATSRSLWKAVANQRARSVFNGLIHVSPGADQTEAHLKTANLLLSAHAEIDTKPELIIEADEVVCSHGATVGQLDDRALFYLRSRGIPEAQARQMLTLAFGGEVLAAISDPELRAAVAERVDAHLPQGSQ